MNKLFLESIPAYKWHWRKFCLLSVSIDIWYLVSWHSTKNFEYYLHCSAVTVNSAFSMRGGHTGPRKKVQLFWATIQKAHKYVLNLRRQLSSSILRFAAHTLNFGVFPVTKHPFKRAFMPKKSKLKFFWVPDKLGSQIVLRIYSESQIFIIFWRFWVSRSLAWDTDNRATPISRGLLGPLGFGRRSNWRHFWSGFGGSLHVNTK